MARPSKLAPEQWQAVESRFHSGETASALAREFGIDEAAIRRKFRRDSPKVREVAEKLAEAQNALAALPKHQQPTAISLADQLRSISVSLAQAAHHGARTAATMADTANKQAARFADLMSAAGDMADPMEHQEKLQAIAALTRISNDSSQLGVSLLQANKARVEKLEDASASKSASDMSDDELALIARG